MAPISPQRITVDVQSILVQSGKTIQNLSEETGISQGKLSRLIATPGRFSIDEFAALVKALRINLASVEVI